MPIPVSPPPPTPPQPGNPLWLPDPQKYAVDQERYRHEDALYHFGEYAIFVLLWRIQDHEAELVARCSTCFTDFGEINETYQQPTIRKCPDCFGTTFEGGFKAKIVRPSLWDFHEADDKTDRAGRGEMIAQGASVQATADFRLRTGDYILRGDGSRWQMKTIASSHLREGFEVPSTERTALGFNFGVCNREDESSVAYIIPPLQDDLIDLLDVAYMRYPADFSDVEIVRGPLT